MLDLFKLFLVILLLLGCTDNDQETLTALTLVDGLKSLTSTEDFVSRYKDFSLLGGGIKSRESLVKPAYHVETYEGTFSHLGYTGRAEVSFCNGALYQVRFYANDFKSYTDKIHDLVIESENIKRWVATDSSGNSYVGYEDKRISENVERWLRRHA